MVLAESLCIGDTPSVTHASHVSFHFYGTRLPHWRLDGATYFVTWRLHRTHGPLTHSERAAVLCVLRRFDRPRYRLRALVVMDDHVHVVVRPSIHDSLEGIVQGWKTFSARRLCAAGRVAPLWQRGYHDRIIRSASDLAEKVNYVRLNPVRRWPGLAEYPWVWIPDE